MTQTFDASRTGRTTHLCSPWTDVPLGGFLWFLPTQMMHIDHNAIPERHNMVWQIKIKCQNPDKRLSHLEK